MYTHPSSPLRLHPGTPHSTPQHVSPLALHPVYPWSRSCCLASQKQTPNFNSLSANTPPYEKTWAQESHHSPASVPQTSRAITLHPNNHPSQSNPHFTRGPKGHNRTTFPLRTHPSSRLTVFASGGRCQAPANPTDTCALLTQATDSNFPPNTINCCSDCNPAQA